MNIYKLSIIVLLLNLGQLAFSQSKLYTKGYISAMPYVMHSQYADSSDTYIPGYLHNRLNFNWYPTDKITASVQFRNLLQGGELMKLMPRPEGFETEAYFLPLTFYQPIGNQYLLSLSADRFWVQYTENNFELTVGRQRINWGQTFAWNPNDIFNSYNFFEVDYEERPGADAVRMQYYTGMTSSIDIAAKLDSANNLTAAAMFRFNKWNYDMQFILGYYSNSVVNDFIAQKEEDFILGAGWSGDLLGMSFRGEGSYFHPLKNFSDISGQFLMSLALDYTFNNQTYIFFEAFYNSIDSLSPGSFLNFYSEARTVKTMSFTKYNFVGQMSYPITPIFNLSFAAMYFFQDSFDGVFVGPSLKYSLSDNMEISAIYQFFGYKEPLLTQNKWASTHFGFVQLRWNF